MRPRGLGLLLGALVLLTACAALPTGPGVLVLPGAGTAVEAFQRDDRECQGYASHQLPAAVALRYGVCAMYVCQRPSGARRERPPAAPTAGPVPTPARRPAVLSRPDGAADGIRAGDEFKDRPGLAYTAPHPSSSGRLT
jgi:hypothetical protein